MDNRPSEDPEESVVKEEDEKLYFRFNEKPKRGTPIPQGNADKAWDSIYNTYELREIK